MREIKFRAWDETNRKMRVVQSIDTFTQIAKFKESYSQPLQLERTDQLMQFTGLLDKNGREIYEGDILSLSEYDRGEVDFFKGGWRVKTPPRYNGDIWRKPLWDAVLDEFAVIGNIHEHPHLLEQADD